MIFYAKTDRGLVRDTNEDSVFMSDTPVGYLPDLFIVCDGMGGYKAGDYASRKAIDTVIGSLRTSNEASPLRALREAIERANRTIYQEARTEDDKEHMGTTMVLASIAAGKLTVANIGDSRLYLLSQGTLRQVSHDHSYVGELVREGRIMESEAARHPKKHYITRAIGAEEDVEPDFFEEEVSKGDEILLCTDGLTNMVPDAKIRSVLISKESPEEAAEALVNLANANGGRDNISCLVIRI